VGYARVSTEQQDLTAQRDGLHALGVGDDRIYVDHGLTGTNRDRPGLRMALAVCRSGDTFVVTKLDRLARSLPDARDILDELTKRNVKLSLGGSIHDPTDPVGRLLFNVLATVAEFEPDLMRMRTGRACRWPRRRDCYAAAAKAEAEPGQASARTTQRRHLQHTRVGRAFRCGTFHDLSDFGAAAGSAVPRFAQSRRGTGSGASIDEKYGRKRRS